MGRKGLTLGQLVSQYRVENHITQGKFARKAGISKSYLHYLECGFNPASGKPIHPSLETVLACCKVMDMDLVTALKKLDPSVVKVIRAQKVAAAKKVFDEERPPRLDEDHRTVMGRQAYASAPENIPTEVRSEEPITSEAIISAIREGRFVVLPDKFPRRGEMVYVPSKEYMMPIPFTVEQVGPGVFSAYADSAGTQVFTLFDINKTVFFERSKAVAEINRLINEAASKNTALSY